MDLWGIGRGSRVQPNAISNMFSRGIGRGLNPEHILERHPEAICNMFTCFGIQRQWLLKYYSTGENLFPSRRCTRCQKMVIIGTSHECSPKLKLYECRRCSILTFYRGQPHDCPVYEADEGFEDDIYIAWGEPLLKQKLVFTKPDGDFVFHWTGVEHIMVRV